MTCKDCIHYDVCHKKEWYLELGNISEHEGVDKVCKFFKDKSNFIELPCKVGDTVYIIENNSVKKWYVGIIKNTGEYWKCELKSNKNKYKYDFRFAKFDDFGKTVFLTKKEAEAKLKELQING